MTPSTEQIRTAIAQQAADWFIANQAGFGDDERREFVAWLRLSQLHVEEYLGIATLERHLPLAFSNPHLDIDALVAAALGDGADGVVPFNPAAKRVVRPSRAVRLHRLGALVASVAVAAAVVLGVGVLWTERSNWLGAPLTYRTQHGERRSWSLPDASALTLNADSEVRIRFSFAGRRTQIVQGRALFQVAHERTRAFEVTAGRASVVAVGTRFEVNLLDGGAVVTVTEGHVLVTATGFAAANATEPSEPRVVRLGQGERVRVDADGGLPPRVEAVDMLAASAWLRGQIVFDERPLAEVADEFNRYAPVPFQILDPALRRLPISGVFGDHDADSFEQFLKSLEGVSVDHSVVRVQVTRRGAAAVPAAGTGR